MNNLETIVEEIRAVFESKNAARDAALERSRALIRFCANAIRAVHRAEFDDAQDLLRQARDAAAEMVGDLAEFPDIYFAGYTQDALKELAEAHITYAVIAGEPIPAPKELGVEPPPI